MRSVLFELLAHRPTAELRAFFTADIKNVFQ